MAHDLMTEASLTFIGALLGAAVAWVIFRIQRPPEPKRSLAAQISHDLRSPLVALESLAKASLTKAEREILRRATGRIRQIANDLTHTKESTAPAAKAEPAEKPLQLPASADLCVVDDDSSIFALWNQRLNMLPDERRPRRIEHVESPEGLDEYIKENAVGDRAFFLVDYELRGAFENGLDLIERHRLSDRAVLVTSRFADSSVRARCQRMGVRLLPKFVATRIDIEFQEPQAQAT